MRSPEAAPRRAGAASNPAGLGTRREPTNLQSRDTDSPARVARRSNPFEPSSRGQPRARRQRRCSSVASVASLQPHRFCKRWTRGTIKSHPMPPQAWTRQDSSRITPGGLRARGVCDVSSPRALVRNAFAASAREHPPASRASTSSSSSSGSRHKHLPLKTAMWPRLQSPQRLLLLAVTGEGPRSHHLLHGQKRS